MKQIVFMMMVLALFSASGQAAKVEKANSLFRAALFILEEVRRSGGSISREHPADPGRAPFPSTWTWKLRNMVLIKEMDVCFRKASPCHVALFVVHAALRH